MPKRIQRSRAKGWKMPKGAVYVGRPSKWGNPFLVEEGRSHEECVERYRRWLYWHQGKIEVVKQALRGKDLACWCPLDQPCHADVLLEIANAEGTERMEK